MSSSTSGQSRSATCTPSHAARELGLKRGEFDLAVHLGLVRTVPDEGGGGTRRVERSEIDRLRAQEDHPETLRERVRVVGTAEGAALMEIPVGRFSRLARLGLLVPVKWYLNRYRAVVWLYLAEDLREFVSDSRNAHLLKGRTPENLRGQLDAGVDLRARNWRGRHLGFLLRQAEDPWVRAGAVAAFLSPVEIADVVKDPYERACLHRFRPAPPGQGAPGSPAAHLVERITTAQDADEIEWLRSDLAHVLREARALTPAPRPAPRSAAAPVRRAAARPIPPMAPTVTRPVAPAAPASAAPRDNPSAPEPRPDRSEPAGEPVSRALAWHGAPVMRAAAPPARPQRDNRRGERAPSRPTRGLRAWLRRRSPRPARL
ncbi:DUF6397 family protein [Streptomyces sp. NBC_00557]|uniref:DUF6397 family protein n=1 Tax=Streptomyces sp. NBC_00557 TaxID=2975776 RepID=UPI002E81AF3F|nr:DUF6397 family protein [Streptomyces sp. NBC_00557]WUC38487.1 DUF6397 family protein [Streptomyces sp. NBC_00557]